MPSLTLPSVVLFVAALHSAGLAALLLQSPGRPRRARLSLVGLLAVIAILLGDLALQYSGAPVLSLPLQGIIGSLWFAIGPLYYGYVRFLLPARAAWEPEDLVHALPIVLQLFVMALLLGTPAAPAPDVLAASRGVLALTFNSLYFLQSVTYAVVAMRIVRSYNARYRQEVAGSADDELASLNRLTRLFGICAAMMGVNMVALVLTGGFLPWLDYLVPLALAALVSAVGYAVLRQPDRVLPELTLPTPQTPSETIASSPDVDRHANALRALMETERAYLDPDIRLADLARRLDVSERTLSHVLADGLGGSFYDVVNGYRVEEAQARLADPGRSHETVLAIGLDAGFSSKASFNRVFKARAGVTPSAYRQRARSAPPAASSMVEAPRPLAPGGDGAVDMAEPVQV